MKTMMLRAPNGLDRLETQDLGAGATEFAPGEFMGADHPLNCRERQSCGRAVRDWTGRIGIES